MWLEETDASGRVQQSEPGLLDEAVPLDYETVVVLKDDETRKKQAKKRSSVHSSYRLRSLIGTLPRFLL